MRIRILFRMRKKRYEQALYQYNATFGADEVEIFSAPGRSEIGGNHTDHQHGEVLAASINRDAIAIVKKLNRPRVTIYRMAMHRKLRSILMIWISVNPRREQPPH